MREFEQDIITNGVNGIPVEEFQNKDIPPSGLSLYGESRDPRGLSRRQFLKMSGLLGGAASYWWLTTRCADTVPKGGTPPDIFAYYPELKNLGIQPKQEFAQSITNFYTSNFTSASIDIEALARLAEFYTSFAAGATQIPNFNNDPRISLTLQPEGSKYGNILVAVVPETADLPGQIPGMEISPFGWMTEPFANDRKGLMVIRIPTVVPDNFAGKFSTPQGLVNYVAGYELCNATITPTSAVLDARARQEGACAVMGIAVADRVQNIPHEEYSKRWNNTELVYARGTSIVVPTLPESAYNGIPQIQYITLQQ